MNTDKIRIHGVRTHNLKDVSLSLPKGKFICLTGVSGSGKSSLAFDTLYAEGQRRYMESLGHHFRSLPRPDVDAIEGLLPTLALSQAQATYSHNTTIASITDLHDLLALLLLRSATQYSPATGKPLHAYTAPQIVEALLKHPEGTRLQLLAPVHLDPEKLQKMGYVRCRIGGQIVDLSTDTPPKKGDAEVIVDRLILKPSSRDRLFESVRLALQLGHGRLIALTDTEEIFSEIFYCPDSDTSYLSLSLRRMRNPDAQALAFRLDGDNITDLLSLTPPQLLAKSWLLPSNISSALLPSIHRRLQTLIDLGLERLPLNHTGDLLSAGEAQRVQLAAEINSDLTGLLYVLDEPTRGLDTAQTEQLTGLLTRLRDQGNTLLIVTHSQPLIAAADHIVDLHEGQIVFEGTYQQLLEADTPTGLYLSGRKAPPPHKKRKPPRITLFTGPSGSGKTTHVFDKLLPKYEGRVVTVDQRAIGVTARSIPASYIGIWSHLRTLYADTPLARARGYRAPHFSLNKKGGRCEACEGRGTVKLKMGFLPDLLLPCELCDGKRFNFETLQVSFKGVPLDQLLAMTFAQARPLLQHLPQIAPRLDLACELGLDYLQIGQPFPTLSGGELQRLKLVAELSRRSHTPTLYILDEPSTGLHPSDLAKLIPILHRLATAGHTLWIIDNHPDLLVQADHIKHFVQLH